MEEKQKTLTSYLIGINAVHIVMCFLILLLKSLGVYSSYVVKGIVLVVVTVVWIIAAVLASLGTNMLKMKTAFTYALLSIVPIAVITLAAFAIGFFTPEGANGWGAFFFIGGAVNFFFRCAGVLSLFLKSAYVIYAVMACILFCASAFGCIIGVNANVKKVRKSRAKKPRAVSSDSPAKTQPPQKNAKEPENDGGIFEDEKKPASKKKKKKKTTVKRTKRKTDDEDF